jgi:hypothetical protein
MSMYSDMAKIPQIARGKVWCTYCKRMQYVDGADCLRNGWPECCGCTMTIDSPQRRSAHARKKAAAQPIDPKELPNGD